MSERLLYNVGDHPVISRYTKACLNKTLGYYHTPDSPTVKEQWKVDGIYNNGLTYYSSFKEILPSGVNSIVDLIPSEGSYLDLFGRAPIINSEQTSTRLSHVFFTGLEHYIFSDSDYSPVMNNVEMHTLRSRNTNEVPILGNLFDQSTWDDIKSRMDEFRISGFNLITCRPLAPFQVSYYPTEKDLNYSWINKEGQRFMKRYFLKMLDQGVSLLNKQYGILLSQIPDVWDINFVSKVLHEYLSSKYPDAQVILPTTKTRRVFGIYYVPYKISNLSQ